MSRHVDKEEVQQFTKIQTQILFIALKPMMLFYSQVTSVALITTPMKRQPSSFTMPAKGGPILKKIKPSLTLTPWREYALRPPRPFCTSTQTTMTCTTLVRISSVQQTLRWKSQLMIAVDTFKMMVDTSTLPVDPMSTTQDQLLHMSLWLLSATYNARRQFLENLTCTCHLNSMRPSQTGWLNWTQPSSQESWFPLRREPQLLKILKQYCLSSAAFSPLKIHTHKLKGISCVQRALIDPILLCSIDTVLDARTA